MPPRSSRGVLVMLTVPKGTLEGLYRGMLLVAGYRDTWLPLEVEITLASDA
jgi:hypothetical protein